MADYELWLDESGDFENELEKGRRGLKASLIGGILIRTEDINSLKLSSHIDMTRNHAMELNETDKRDYILPFLQHVKQNGGCEVFFENLQREERDGNRSLYIHMMAEGLMQLIQELNAQDPDLHLNVIIARRQDKTNTEKPIIESDEYLVALSKCIDRKRKEHRIALTAGCEINYCIKIANSDEKLVAADFACNTRLTRDSNAFRECREEVMALYDGARIFTLHENPSKNYIEICLAKNLISDAIVELYSTWDKLDHDAILDSVFERIGHMSYRLIKSQLRQNRIEMISLIASETNYEDVEKMLEQLERELLPRIEKLGENFADYAFEIYMAISDIYLREGDLNSAERVLEKCENTQNKLGNALENLLTFYRLAEKKALYLINAYDFDRAEAIMNEACKGFESAMSIMELNDSLQKRYPVFTSEYYGDALCMQIYALMLDQRVHPEHYDMMVRLSDIAMTQYPNYEGELERHRQYRSRIESCRGNCDSALKWLIQAKMYGEPTTEIESIKAFLAELYKSEESGSCQYYLMYYLRIMHDAENRDAELRQRMKDALFANTKLLRKIGLNTENDENGQRIPIQNVKPSVDRDRLYHPMEVIELEYARLLYFGDKSDKARAIDILKRTLKQGQRVNHYITLRMACLPIGSELIRMLSLENKKYDGYLQNLMDEADKLLDLKPEDSAVNYVEQWKKYMKAGKWEMAADMLVY